VRRSAGVVALEIRRAHLIAAAVLVALAARLVRQLADVGVVFALDAALPRGAIAVLRTRDVAALECADVRVLAVGVDGAPAGEPGGAQLLRGGVAAGGET